MKPLKLDCDRDRYRVRGNRSPPPPSSDAGAAVLRRRAADLPHAESDASPEEWGMEAAAAGQRLAIPEDEPSPFASSEPAPATTATFPALTPAKFKLTAIADTLRRSRNYQPLAHFGWTQPGYPRGDAKYLPINSLVPAGSGLRGSGRAVARPLSAPHARSRVRRTERGRRGDATLRAAPEPQDAQQRTALHGFAEIWRDRDSHAERSVR